MTEKSEEVTENTQAPPKKEEEIVEKTKNEQENTQALPKNEVSEESQPEPKARGRPKGVRDTKPRVKRIPITPPEQEAPKTKPKKVQVREEPEEQEPEQDPPQADAQPPTPEPVKIKSPRTQRRERMQAFSAQRHAELKARQNRFDSLIDNFMGY
jgi:hypothetical protein